MAWPEDLPKLRLAGPAGEKDLPRPPKADPLIEINPEDDVLEMTLSGFKVGSVPYLNAVPLTRGIEDQIQFVVPSRLGDMLRAGELDAALLSVTEVLFNDRYDILDGICIGSLGEVFSVYLAHTTPLEELTLVHCDPASLTSVNLLRVLLGERGIRPEFVPLIDYTPELMPENVLLIGDPAIRFRRTNPSHQIWDLGSAWMELTNLPFVYAVWALRRDRDTRELRRILRETRDFGQDTLDDIIRDRAEFDMAFRKDYLGWHIHYHLGEDEKRGLAKFVELLRKHSGLTVFDPTFVS